MARDAEGAGVALLRQQLGGVARVQPRITGRGGLRERGAARVLVANRGGVFPPFLRLGADIAPDDGVLDVVVLSATGLAESMGVLWQLVRGAPNGSGNVQYARGHEVRVAYDGLEAVGAAVTFRPDVVLLDIGLPKLSGNEAARRIREARGDEVLLVAVTGWGQEEDRRRALESGFDHHLTKPVDPGEITRIIDAIPPTTAAPR